MSPKKTGAVFLDPEEYEQIDRLVAEHGVLRAREILDLPRHTFDRIRGRLSMREGTRLLARVRLIELQADALNEARS